MGCHKRNWEYRAGTHEFNRDQTSIGAILVREESSHLLDQR
jgi:hypothetical protein